MKCHSTYLIGNTVEIRARPQDGTEVDDASAWTLLVLAPGGTDSTEYPMTAVDGLAVASFVPNVAGRWRYRVEVSSPVESAFEAYIDIRARSVPAPTP